MAGDAKEGEVLDNTSDKEKKSGKTRTVRSIKMSVEWEAPYPPPEVLNQYSSKDKKEIFKAVTAERQHRHKQESKMVDARIANSGKAVNYTFILLGAGLIAGTVLILNDKDGLGIATIFGTSVLPLGARIVKLLKDWGHVHNDAGKETDSQVSKPKRKVSREDSEK